MRRHFKGRCRKSVFGHKAVDCRKKMGKTGNQFIGFESKNGSGNGPRNNFNKKAIKCYNCGQFWAIWLRIVTNQRMRKLDRANQTVAGTDCLLCV